MPPGIMGVLVKRLPYTPRYLSAVMFEVVSGVPLIGPPDAGRRQPLGPLIVVIIPVFFAIENNINFSYIFFCTICHRLK